MSGIKYDDGKIRRSLLPWKQVEQIALVMTTGAIKYSPNNWKRVKPIKERYFDAMQRHIHAWNCGEINDPETGLHHLAHAGCCLLFLMWGCMTGKIKRVKHKKVISKTENT